MEQIPKPGQIYRHFKNRLYQVIAVARHTETDEELVIYQALYGTYGVYARPLAMFMGEVDKEKYPDVRQTLRFERVEAARLMEDGQGESHQAGTGSKPCESEKGDREPEDLHEPDGTDNGGSAAKDCGQALNPLLLSFVETQDFDVKLEILSAMEDDASQEDADALCEALDLPGGTGDAAKQLRAVRQYLEMRKKFDSRRLR